MALDATYLAVGATADLYAWGEGYVLKLFHAGRPSADIEVEARAARTVYEVVSQSGALRVPAVGARLDWEGRQGLVYERINGLSLLSVLLHREMTQAAIRSASELLANLHVLLHTEVPLPPNTPLPRLRDRLTRALERTDVLPDALNAAVRRCFDSLPDTVSCLCHGDLHPGNVLMPPQSDPVVIDWCDATQGDPLADVARTVLLLDLAAIPNSPQSAQIEERRAAFRDAYLEHYCRQRKLRRDAVDVWCPVVAAARLTENITADGRQRLLLLVKNTVSG